MKSKPLPKGEISKKGVEEVAAIQVMPGSLIWVRLNGGSWWPAQIVDENSDSIKPGHKSAGKVRVRLYGSNTYMYVDPVKCHSKFELELKQNNGCYRRILEKALGQDRPHSKSGRSKGQESRSKVYGRIDASGEGKTSKRAVYGRIDASGEGKTSKRAVYGRIDASGEGKTSKQKVVQKKLDLDSPSVRLPSRRAKEEARMKICKQDGPQKSLKRHSTSSDAQPDDETHEQDRIQKTPKQSNKSAEKDKINSPSSETTLFGKSPELSARRMKVMQSLGLIAPSGSPFHKNGHTYLSLC